MFKEFIESKGLNCTEIPNIYNDGLSASSHLYNWDLRFNVDDIQVIINCDSETIRYIDHRKEVKTSKEKTAFKNIIKEYASMHDLSLIA
jgi:hypothetical protein